MPNPKLKTISLPHLPVQPDVHVLHHIEEFYLKPQKSIENHATLVPTYLGESRLLIQRGPLQHCGEWEPFLAEHLHSSI